jgi:general secretion pathway protein H
VATARIKTLPAGDGPRGFTLIELLVVLAILGLVVALTVPVFYRVSPALELRTAARTVAATLREARGRAIGENAEAVLTIDLDAHSLQVDGGPAVLLSPRLGITLVTATREMIDSGAGRIRFYPDGTSTGGRITLALDERRYHVVVDWITGRVTANE